MKVIILCGGKGTRLREETGSMPKPMVPIGGKPILWHIMKIYANFGFKDFVLCLGYKGDVIRRYFLEYLQHNSDFSVKLAENKIIRLNTQKVEDWTVTLADTGEETLTAGRIERAAKYLGNDEQFLLTYGDGVGNIDIKASIDFHEKGKSILTLTAVHPPGRFGELSLNEAGDVSSFNEKPQTEVGWINGGFFVAERAILNYLIDSDDKMFEREPMQSIAKKGLLRAYRHEGFWQPMDTYHEYNLLNQLWRDGKAPWKIWKD